MDQNLKRSIARLSLDWENYEKDLDLDFTLKEMAVRITELRLVSGLSRTEFAEKAGIKPAHLSRLVSGHHNPSILFLEEMAQKVGAHMEISFVMDDGETCHEKVNRYIGTKSVPKTHNS